MWQHTEGMVATGKYYIDFVGNLLLFPAVKNWENPLSTDKVITMSLVYYFLGDTVYMHTRQQSKGFNYMQQIRNLVALKC